MCEQRVQARYSKLKELIQDQFGVKIKKSEEQRLIMKIQKQDSSDDDELPQICGEEDLRYYM
jgi:hypothetical protein